MVAAIAKISSLVSVVVVFIVTVAVVEFSKCFFKILSPILRSVKLDFGEILMAFTIDNVCGLMYGDCILGQMFIIFSMCV